MKFGKQVGGTHYEGMNISPIEIGMKLNMNPCAFNILKYVARHDKKNGAEDLRKAIQYCDIWLETDKDNYTYIEKAEEEEEYCDEFIRQFNDIEFYITSHLLSRHLRSTHGSNNIQIIKDYIIQLLKERYNEEV